MKISILYSVDRELYIVVQSANQHIQLKHFDFEITFVEAAKLYDAEPLKFRDGRIGAGFRQKEDAQNLVALLYTVFEFDEQLGAIQEVAKEVAESESLEGRLMALIVDDFIEGLRKDQIDLQIAKACIDKARGAKVH